MAAPAQFNTSNESDEQRPGRGSRAEIAGLRAGSSSSTCAGVISVASMHRATGFDPPVHVGGVVDRRDDEQPASVLYGMRDDSTQDAILFDALARGSGSRTA